MVWDSHIIRAMYALSYETMEVTGPQMVLTMKLTTFAWNVWDGRRPSGVSHIAVDVNLLLTSSQGFGQMAVGETHYPISFPP